MTPSAPSPSPAGDDALIRWLRRGNNDIWAIALLWLGLSAFMISQYWGQIADFQFRDADDAMRMAQVRDFVAGQGWFDVSQHRVNPPYGGPMHWSRLVDLPIAGLILLLRPLTGTVLAEQIAITLVPLLTLGGISFTLYLAVRPLLGRPVAVLAIACLLTTLSVLVQNTPMRIDHHGWQMGMAAALVYGLLAPSARRGGLIMGGAMALWLHISTEGLPYAAIAGAILALRYAVRPDEEQRLNGYAIAMTLGSALLLLMTHGWRGSLISYCDAMSPIYLAPLALVFGALCIGQKISGNSTMLRRIIAVTLAGVAGAALYAAISGPCIRGPFRTLDPLVYDLWYMGVMEGLPIWEQGMSMMGIILAPSLIGMAGYGLACWSEKDPRRRFAWLSLFGMMLGCFLVSLMVMRTMATAHMIASIGTAWLIAQLCRPIARQDKMPVRILLSSLLILISPLGATIIADRAIALSNRDAPERPKQNLKKAANIQSLRAIPATTIFTPIDIGPDILVHTPHIVIGTGHHRNIVGIKKVLEAFTYPPEKARSVIFSTSASHLAIAPALPEIARYRHFAPHGLAAELAQGKTPDWLIAVDLPDSDIKLYRIDRTKTQARKGKQPVTS